MNTDRDAELEEEQEAETESKFLKAKKTSIEVRWSSQDMKELRSWWPPERCEAFFGKHAQGLWAAIMGAGWDYLRKVLEQEELARQTYVCSSATEASDWEWRCCAGRGGAEMFHNSRARTESHKRAVALLTPQLKAFALRARRRVMTASHPLSTQGCPPMKLSSPPPSGAKCEVVGWLEMNRLASGIASSRKCWPSIT